MMHALRPHVTVRPIVSRHVIMAALALGMALTLGGCGVASTSAGATSHATATPAQPVGTLPSEPRGQWLALPHLTSAFPLVVSHADPRVAYIASLPLSGGPNVPILRRTDDSGATWHDLPLPPDVAHPSAVSGLFVAASPQDISTVFLEVEVSATAACAQPSTQAYTGGRLYAGQPQCATEYVSRDGGSHWHIIALPPNGSLDFMATRPGFQAQGKRLYALMDDLNPATTTAGKPTRLGASDDGGQSWGYVDAALVARGLRIASYTPSPSDGTLFAVTVPGSANNPTDSPPLPPLRLWRSADSGATWTAIGPLPDTLTSFGDVQLVAATSTLLYSEMEGSIDRNVPYDLEVSMDGGASWRPIPAQDATTLPAPQADLIATLADGSALVGFSNFGMGVSPYTTLYRWKPGDATLRQVTSPLPDAGTVVDISLMRPSGANATTTVWVVVQTANGYAVRHVTLP